MKTINLPGGSHAVLVLHGLMGNPLEMRFIGKQLQKAGFSVIVPLIVGYGYATGQGSTIGTTTHEKWYVEVQKHFDQLKQNYKTVSVVGLCIGAVLALRLAIDRSDDIAGLTLLATTLDYDGWSIPKYRFLLPIVYYTPLRYIYAYKERYPYGLKNTKLRTWIESEMTINNSSAAGASHLSAEGIFQAHRLINEVKSKLNLVSTPALVIHAQEDDVASVKSADRVMRQISSSVKRKIILDDSYHIITMDNEKKRVAAETVSFLHSQLAISNASSN